MPAVTHLVLVVVDDDPHFQFFLKHGLARCGISHEIITLKNGPELLAMLSQPKTDSIDCILLDMNMPIKNGTDILAEIEQKKLAVGIPIIITSQAIDPAYIPQILKLGAVKYLEKPSGLDEFMVFAKKVLAAAAEKQKLEKFNS